MSVIYSSVDDKLHIVNQILMPESISEDGKTVCIMAVAGGIDLKNPPIEVKLWSEKGIFSSTAKIIGKTLLRKHQSA